MKESEITALAREYAEWVTEAEGDDNAYIPAETAMASVLLRWLSRRYCLVEKSRIDALDIAGRAKEYGMVTLSDENVAYIFPDIAKEVEGEKS